MWFMIKYHHIILRDEIMTTGKKISILRKNLGITQIDFAEALDLHIASIRKYEADKMKPKTEHIEKIASILNVNPYILSKEEFSLKIKTLGDLYTVIFELYKSGIICLFIKNSNEVYIKINKQFNHLLNIITRTNDVTSTISSLQLLISFNEKIKLTNKYEIFTKWAIQSQELLDFKNNLYDSNNLMAKKTIQEYQYKIDVLELTLQQSTELLNEL